MSDLSRQAKSPTFAVPIALFTVYVIWGSTYYAIRVALEAFPPLLQGGLRFLVAGVVLMGVLLAQGQSLPSARQWRHGIYVGTLLLGVGNGGVVYAEQTVPSGVAALFIGASPLCAALLSGLLGQWPGRRQWSGIGIGLAGVILLSSGDVLTSQPAGLIALIAAVLCWNIGSLMSKGRWTLAPGFMGFATQMVGGGAVLTALAMLHRDRVDLNAPWPAFAAYGYLVVAGSLAAFSAYMYLLSRVSTPIAMSYAYVNPVIALGLGAVFGHEPVGLREVSAMALVLVAVALITWPTRKPVSQSSVT